MVQLLSYIKDIIVIYSTKNAFATSFFYLLYLTLELKYNLKICIQV